MIPVHETAYPRLNPDPSPQELNGLYTPNAEERNIAARWATDPLIRLTALVALKIFQRMGRFVPLKEVPAPIRDHVTKQYGWVRVPPIQSWQRVESLGSWPAVLQRLRRYLDVQEVDAPALSWLEQVARHAAQTKYLAADILNVMLEELIHHRYVLPAYSTLERIAVHAREQQHTAYFAAITHQLSAETQALMDGLFVALPGEQYSSWQLLKQEPKQPTNKETARFLHHLRRLGGLADRVPKPDIPIPLLKHFRVLARALDAGEMKALKSPKRYALAVIFLRAQYAQTKDDVADLFVRLIQRLENSAERQLADYQQAHQKQVDVLVGQLKELLMAYSQSGSDTQRLAAMTASLVADPEGLMTLCDEHLAYAGSNYLPFMLKPYRVVRAQLLNCIEILELRATNEDRSLERMIQLMLTHRDHRLQRIPLASWGLSSDRDFGWTTGQWRKQFLSKAINSAGQRIEVLHRHYFELAILQQIKHDLKSGDLFVPYGERYDDYREQLVDEETYAQEIGAYGQVTEIDVRPSSFVRSLKSSLAAVAQRIDAAFPENAHADIVEGQLVLRKPPRMDASPETQRLDAAITERLPSTSIVDVLVDSEQWLNLHALFKPLAGTESRLEDLRLRVITTLFCYGCNLGTVQTARSIKGLSRRQLAWLNLKYVSEPLLDKAITQVINAYHQFELPRYWGTGKHASADGTKWNLYEQNLISEHHIRYGGYGGIGYYHVSDKYIALFSHFISCGTYEGIYILDVLMNNESDIQPDTLHGDTQSQSYPVFALAHLLGIQLMPRIRGIDALVLFRPEAGVRYKHIDSLFKEAIDWPLIETHLPDMLRVALSVKLGKISASAILRRLGTYSRKNRLYFAFRELGKVLRTRFLLNYIGDVEMRRVIHAETNKCEQFNGFLRWSFFGGEGVIAENIRHEQRKVVKYNQLVANMIILHNVVGMTRVLEGLRDEGFVITPETLKGLAPYRTAHINRFGDYTIDLHRKVMPINHKTKIILSESED